MEINEATILDDRGFIKINGDEAKSFLQNIVTNDIEKITDNLTLFSSIFEMPNTNPPTSNQTEFNKKLSLAKNRMFSNYAFYFGATPHNLSLIHI